MNFNLTAFGRRLSGYLLAAALSPGIAPVGAAAPQAPAVDPGVLPWQLNAVATQLQGAAAELRADLAGIALDELATAYAQEALKARGDQQHHTADRELQRWADAVDRLATHLATLAESVTSLTAVHIDVSPEHSLYLVIDGEPVVVSGPRTDRQAALEQRILERFCNLHSCAQLFAGNARIASLPTRAPAPANPHWRFSDAAGPVCSSGDGLDFAFRDSNNLLHKRSVCKRVIDELNTLAEAIAYHSAGGARIDWDALAIRGASAEGAHEVQISRDGSTLRMPLHLPLLTAAPRLLEEARPWLTARIDGRQQRVVIENAEQLLALDAAP
ncbi:MAG: hypothetical protein J5I92_03180 [Thiogranum sp.]|nr:hypothetical protein [Thiogranum sp.]